MDWVIKDFVDWRNTARALLLAKTPPDEVLLRDEASNLDLFNSSSDTNNVGKDEIVKLEAKAR